MSHGRDGVFRSYPAGTRRRPPDAPVRGAGRGGAERGVVSLEAVLMLPVLALVIMGLVHTAAIVRDVLLLHEAARAGVRAAATSTGTSAATAAARVAAPELTLEVVVDPVNRVDGQLVTVQVSAERAIGTFSHELDASAVARVEPVVVGDRAPPRSQP